MEIYGLFFSVAKSCTSRTFCLCVLFWNAFSCKKSQYCRWNSFMFSDTWCQKEPLLTSLVVIWILRLCTGQQGMFIISVVKVYESLAWNFFFIQCYYFWCSGILMLELWNKKVVIVYQCICLILIEQALLLEMHELFQHIRQRTVQCMV